VAEQPSLMRRLFTLRASPPPVLKKLLGALGVVLVVALWWLLTLGSTPE
jgi:hypothetical protein